MENKCIVHGVNCAVCKFPVEEVAFVDTKIDEEGRLRTRVLCGTCYRSLLPYMISTYIDRHEGEGPESCKKT